MNTLERLAPKQDMAYIWNVTISHGGAGCQKLGGVGTVLINRKRRPAVFQMMEKKKKNLKKLCNFAFSLL